MSAGMLCNNNLVLGFHIKHYDYLVKVLVLSCVFKMLFMGKYFFEGVRYIGSLLNNTINCTV